jgi:hypothetical protein
LKTAQFRPVRLAAGRPGQAPGLARGDQAEARTSPAAKGRAVEEKPMDRSL